MGEKQSWRPKEQRAAQNAEILAAVARGEAPKEIAERLGLSNGTVIGVISRAGAEVKSFAALRRRLRRERLARLAKIAARSG